VKIKNKLSGKVLDANVVLSPLRMTLPAPDAEPGEKRKESEAQVFEAEPGDFVTFDADLGRDVFLAGEDFEVVSA